MASAKKTATIYIEVGPDKKKVNIEDLQKAVKRIEGAKNAYVNAEEGAMYVVASDEKTTKVIL